MCRDGRSGTLRTMSECDVVTVRGLRKSYGGRSVVDGVGLDIQAGEVVGLIGAHGAGKTTTMECIQGLRRPDAGCCGCAATNPVTHADRVRPLIGSQLQDSALPDRLRGSDSERWSRSRYTERSTSPPP